jgi:DNA-binding winged helix-turn-helix (wHTH) protein
MLREYESIGDALSVIESAQPSGIVVIGVSQPDPLDWLRHVRPQSGNGWIPVAIIGSADELPALPDSSQLLCPEVSSRLRNLLRTQPPAPGNLRKVAVDARAREVSSNGRRKSFSPAEFRLLMFLLRHPGVVFSREELNRRISPDSRSGYRRIIDVLVKRIRAKLPTGGQHYLRTVRGLGYTFGFGGDTFVDAVTRQEVVSWPPAVETCNKPFINLS